MGEREERTRAVITRFYALLNARRFDEMWTLFHPQATWSGGSGTGRSLDEMRALLIDPNPLFVGGGIDFELDALTAEGDRVAAEVRSFATLVNGRVYNNHYHMLFIFDGDRIVRVKEYNDTLHAHQTFGDLELPV